MKSPDRSSTARRSIRDGLSSVEPLARPRRRCRQSRTAGEEATNSEVTLTFSDNRLTSLVLGQYDQNIAKLERRLNVVANANGNHIVVKGAPEACDHARRVLEALYARVAQGEPIALGDVDGAIEEGALQGTLFPKEVVNERLVFDEIRTRKRGAVKARTVAQDLYLRALKKYELVFAEGPAGTGKTWLAVGHAVSLLERGAVERLILSRPAVEAGERLGFLPGDMREKIDPYLRPIYDALNEFMDARTVERSMQTGIIEVAPLAFMRGRTLSNAVVPARRSAEHDLDADEDDADPPRRRFAHDHQRGSQPDRLAAWPEIRPEGGDIAPDGRRRDRPRHVPGGRRRPARSRAADRFRL